MDGNLNKGAWESMESTINKLASSDEISKVHVDMDILYGPQKTLRPDSFEISVTVETKEGVIHYLDTKFANKIGQSFEKDKELWLAILKKK